MNVRRMNESRTMICVTVEDVSVIFVVSASNVSDPLSERSAYDRHGNNNVKTKSNRFIKSPFFMQPPFVEQVLVVEAHRQGQASEVELLKRES